MQDLKKMTINIFVVVVAALVVLGVWMYYFGPKDKAELEFDEMTVEAEVVRRGSIVRRVTVVGVMRADNEVTLRPEIEGKIKVINFAGGMPVQKGDALVEIEDGMYRAQVKEAEATLQFAEAEYQRYEALAQQAAGPQRKKEEALAQKLQAEARLALARIKLDNTVIRAPFSGIVGLKEYSIGSFIDPRTELLSIVDVDPIKLDFRLPALYQQYISRGQEVKVMIDSLPQYDFRAKIDAIDPKIDKAANSVLVRAVIPNQSALLRPGLFARVNLVVGAKDNVLLVPEAAILSRIDEEHVYKIIKHSVKGKEIDIVVRAPVTTGLSEAGVVEIVRGLNAGDRIVTVGLNKIREGFPVRVVEDIEEVDFDEDVDFSDKVTEADDIPREIEEEQGDEE